MKEKIVKIIREKHRGSFVAKVIPLMLTIVFGALITFLMIDSATVMQKKKESDDKLQKVIDYCIQTNASDDDIKTLLKEVAVEIWGSNVSPIAYSVGDEKLVGVTVGADVDVSVLKTQEDLKKFKATYRFFRSISLR